MLKSLSETRWCARADVLRAIVSSHKEIKNALEDLIKDNTQTHATRVSAEGFHKTLRKFSDYFNNGDLGRNLTKGGQNHRYECPKCGKDMILRERKGGYEWRCHTKAGENPHDVCKSVRKVVPNRTKEELLSVIKEWVVPGSYNFGLLEGLQLPVA
ncbi:hypothetical protein TNCV_1004041 [Trichonephila clavipes]|nr:hypothetical protein TNCV_1004041 [Trichonephila clavipes]